MAVAPLTDAQVTALIAGGMNPDTAGVHQAFSICGIHNQGRVRLVLEVLTSLYNLRDYSSKELDNIARSLHARPPAARGAAIY